MLHQGHIMIPPVCDVDALEPVAGRFWNSLWRKVCRNCQKALEETDDNISGLVWNSLPEPFRVDIGPDDWETSSVTVGTDAVGPDTVGADEL